MIVIKQVQLPDGHVQDIFLPSQTSQVIDGRGLTLLPALIDPHVHFRVPGAEHKENWITGAQAAIRGGVTTVFDMPNNQPSCTTLELLLHKHSLIKEQIKESGNPLRYHLYFGADKRHLSEIPKVKNYAIGIKIFMGSSTGDLLIDDDVTLNEIFKIASDNDMLISVHAEDEEIIRKKKKLHEAAQDSSCHSIIRCRTAAIKAVNRAIVLADKYKTRLCILHVTTKEEVDLIRQAKAQKLLVYGEASPHHLLLSTKDYAKWGAYVQCNPPLREEEDQHALWKGINDGAIDFIGTDHAPHTIEEKRQPYGKAPSGIPSIDLLLPLLLDSVHKGKMSLETLIKLTRTNIESIFSLSPNPDYVLVSMNRKQEVRDEELKTKCGWSPYNGTNLTGWPVHTIIDGKIFNFKESLCLSKQN